MDIPGVYFHLYNKGVESRTIFADQADYDVFLQYIRQYLTLPQDRGTLKTQFEINGHTYEGVPHLPKNYYKDVELVAYSLHSHHFHLLLKENTPGTMGKFMRSLCTRYAIYYNNKYRHVGGLFQGTYVSRMMTDISQVKLLTYYLHHGGIQTSLKAYLAQGIADFPSVASTLAAFGLSQEQYIAFISSEALGQEDLYALQTVLIPCETDHLAKKNLTSGAVLSKNRQRNIFLTIALFGFLFLSGISTRNILSQRKVAIVPAVITPTYTPTVFPTSQPLFAQTEPEPDVLAAQDVDDAHSVKLQVRITGQALRVNIRSNPLADAPIIAKAYDGDILESTDKIDNWYAVKLPDGEIGYILGSNVVITK